MIDLNSMIGNIEKNRDLDEEILILHLSPCFFIDGLNKF